MRKHRALWAILLIAVITAGMLPSPAAAAQGDEEIEWPSGPDVSGDGAIVVEAGTGSILYAKNIYDTFYPASTTKIMTTLVALENSEMNEIVTVSYAADNYVSKTSSRMGLVEDEQITMEQALYGIMLESANEATYAVGEHVGGSIAGFIKLMNRKAYDLHCTNTHFANSHGLHDEDHYTCPYDLSLIALAAYKNPEFMKITGTATYAMPATNKNDAKILTNHHWFLNKQMKYDYCIGGKTGATTQAGYALVTYAKKDGMTLISVVMHAPTWEAVYTDSKNLLDYCFDNFNFYRMENLGGAQSEFPPMFGEIAGFDEDRQQLLSTGGGGVVILPDSISISDTQRTVVLDADAEKGHGANPIGTISYTYGDKIVGMADIIYYNSADPMTESRFAAGWPAFLIPVDVAMAGVEAFSELNTAEKVPEKLSDVIPMNRAVPVIIGVGGGLVFLLLGLAVILILRKR